MCFLGNDGNEADGNCHRAAKDPHSCSPSSQGRPWGWGCGIWRYQDRTGLGTSARCPLGPCQGTCHCTWKSWKGCPWTTLLYVLCPRFQTPNCFSIHRWLLYNQESVDTADISQCRLRNAHASPTLGASFAWPVPAPRSGLSSLREPSPVPFPRLRASNPLWEDPGPPFCSTFHSSSEVILYGMSSKPLEGSAGRVSFTVMLQHLAQSPV